MYENMSKQYKILLILLVLVFGVNIIYSFYFKITPAIDARAYDNIAWNIAQGNGYRESADMPFIEDNSIVRVGPGYEFFLAAIYYVFGHNYAAVWVIQALLLALSAFLIFFVSKEVFGKDWNFLIGIIAAVLVGFSPDLITLQGMLMSETLGIFLIILTVYLFFRHINKENPSISGAVLSSISLAFTALVRTPAIFLLLSVIGYYIFRRQWKFLAVFLTVFIILFMPWAIRNYIVFHAFIPTNLAYGLDLAAGNHPGASGELEPHEISGQLIEQYGYLKANSLLLREAVGFIFSHPLEFLKITFYRISIYFSFARPTGFWFHLHGLSRALTLASSAFYSALLFFFGFWGIWKIKDLKEQKLNAQLLLYMLIMMPLAVIGIVVETRYRSSVYPFFAVFAGYGINLLWQKKAEWKPIFYIALLFLANTFFDILRNFGRIIGRIQELIK